MPVVAQRQVPMIPNVHKTVEVPQIQYVDKIVDAPVVARVEDDSVGTQTVSRKRKLPLETESADGTSDSEHGLVQGWGRAGMKWTRLVKGTRQARSRFAPGGA